ncbi:phage tail sheath family protein [Actinoplanes sp. HUAS TT8]|uniref:phage tail sheath family protein n=1 Tax=Actinoplanes sp. HUAS TT8 TaxID=3447453 RepID=UPI003F52830C
MPEYLTPAVYVEETSFRARSIEGVATSTLGLAGLTRYGPISYRLTDDEYVVQPPPLITSYGEFERAFGGLGPVKDDTNYLAFAARAYFANGGRRLYVSRVFNFPRADGAINVGTFDLCFARRPVGAEPAAVPGAEPPVRPTWRARWPGSAGQEIKVEVTLRRGRNVIVRNGDGDFLRLSTVRPFDLVQVTDDEDVPTGAPDADDIRLVQRIGDDLRLTDDDGVVEIGEDTRAYQLQLQVVVTWGTRSDTYSELAVHPEHPRSITRTLSLKDGADDLALVWLRLPPPPDDDDDDAPGPVEAAAGLLTALLDDDSQGFLTGGNDGADPAVGDFGGEESNPDDPRQGATGLNALTDVDDVAIVAMPDSVRFGADMTAVGLLVEHAERQRYRIAVVDPPKDSSISDVRQFRAQFDSRYAALYYPWVEIIDPTVVPDAGAPPPVLRLPPSGFVTGIYARSDIERGVYKAPANEVIRGIRRIETNVTFDRQSTLNPEGINALRFFPGRGNRVWGARTLSSDPEWKYVNVRRLFIFLEHSIDKATQWAVFEPNNERLWASIRRSVEDFLFIQWRDGALLGGRPEEAYFVRCDRSTMSQNDLDNGRLICLVGVAPTYPAEFVIFRIGQWTADAQRS